MKRIVGIFAHPDDEALGPSGALAIFAKTHEVYLICATSGEANGKTAEEKLELGEIRREELRRSAKTLGIKDVQFLGYQDGDLCNNLYHKLADDIQKHLEVLRPEKILTFEQRGVSGHIDHITVSCATTFVFNKLPFIQELYYYVISKERSDTMRDYFIYCPIGYERDEVDEVMDVSSVWETKVEAMKCHGSQVHDVEQVLRTAERLPKEEYFFIRRNDHFKASRTQ